jgi:hypothetical protein
MNCSFEDFVTEIDKSNITSTQDGYVVKGVGAYAEIIQVNEKNRTIEIECKKSNGRLNKIGKTGSEVINFNTLIGQKSIKKYILYAVIMSIYEGILIRENCQEYYVNNILLDKTGRIAPVGLSGLSVNHMRGDRKGEELWSKDNIEFVSAFANGWHNGLSLAYGAVGIKLWISANDWQLHLLLEDFLRQNVLQRDCTNKIEIMKEFLNRSGYKLEDKKPYVRIIKK